jgi:hypothetical protein
VQLVHLHLSMVLRLTLILMSLTQGPEIWMMSLSSCPMSPCNLTVDHLAPWTPPLWSHGGRWGRR